MSSPFFSFLILSIFCYSCLGHEAFNTQMTEQYFLYRNVDLCKTYLSDDIFRRNNIFLYTQNSENTIMFEEKVVKFDYFSRKNELVEVVACPVLRNNEESRIYFLEFNFNEAYHNRNTMRGYFAFENTHDYIWSREIRILMYTPYNDIPFEDLDLLGEQIATYTPEIIKVEATQIPIRTIHIPFELTNEVANSFRAFGEVVEVYFLTKHYGFFDTLRTYWKVKNLILIMDQLRRGKIDLENGNMYSH